MVHTIQKSFIKYKDWGVKAMIPAATTSKTQDELKNRPRIKKLHLEQRDNMIKEIRKQSHRTSQSS